MRTRTTRKPQPQETFYESLEAAFSAFPTSHQTKMRNDLINHRINPSDCWYSIIKSEGYIKLGRKTQTTAPGKTSDVIIGKNFMWIRENDETIPYDGYTPKEDKTKRPTEVQPSSICQECFIALSLVDEQNGREVHEGCE